MALKHGYVVAAALSRASSDYLQLTCTDWPPAAAGQVCENNVQLTSTINTPLKREGILALHSVLPKSFIQVEIMIVLTFVNAFYKVFFNYLVCNANIGVLFLTQRRQATSDLRQVDWIILECPEYFKLTFILSSFFNNLCCRENPAVKILGSHAAMTCHIVVMRHTKSHVASLGKYTW